MGLVRTPAEIGKVIGRLSILKEVEQKNGVRMVLCKCKCGNSKVIGLSKVINKYTLSCGCIRREKAISMCQKHGMYGTKIYKSWVSMKERISNKKHMYYYNYGGRGIRYCKKRETFEGFYEDMWSTYKEGLTLDRIDNNGNYCKENCRRATRKEQSRNKRNNVVYKGMCIAEWCEKLGINQSTVSQRVSKQGASISIALGEPVTREQVAIMLDRLYQNILDK